MPDGNLPVPVRGMNSTVIELAQWAGVSTDAIRKDIQNGCPVVRPGLVGSFPAIINSHDWLHWKIARVRAEKRQSAVANERGAILGDAKQRALEATAGKREAELAKMRGELIAIADLDDLISEEFVTLRTALLGVEDELRPIIGPNGAKIAQDYVIAAVNRSVESAETIPERYEESRR